MSELLQDPKAQLVIGLAIVCVMSAIAIYISAKMRPKSIQQEQNAEDLLTKFRDSRAKGELSEDEYRTIKATVADRIQRERDEPEVEH